VFFPTYPAAYIHIFLGKSTFFVYNQSKIENLPAEKLGILEAQLKEVEEENKLLAAEAKTLSAGIWSSETLVIPWSIQPLLELAKIKYTPTDSELDAQVVQTEEKVRISPSPALCGGILSQYGSRWSRF
jgi:26S proteasome regulatory subunit (ATPase 3-interacting protein)